jgi:hypothetical protein
MIDDTPSAEGGDHPREGSESFLLRAQFMRELEIRLFERLREASWIHQNPDHNSGGTRWSGVILACHAVAQFIHDSGLDPELGAPLMEVMEGFKDLERGIVAPIFSLEHEPLERDRSTHRKFQQAWAAAILEIFVETGEAERASAEKIARDVSRWLAFSNQEVTADTVMNWRKGAKGEEASSFRRKSFDSICKALREHRERDSMIKSVLADGPPGLRKS